MAVFAAIGAVGAEPPPGTPMPEYAVKGAFLLNFAKYVEWPEGSFKSTDAPIVIGILGDDPFGDGLDRLVSGKTVRQRRLVVRRFASAQQAKSCHILFIGPGKPGELRPAVAAVGTAHVLTVGESDGFLKAGGVIRLFVEKDSVRFELSRGAAARAGLTISSQLLNLARLAD